MINVVVIKLYLTLVSNSSLIFYGNNVVLTMIYVKKIGLSYSPLRNEIYGSSLNILTLNIRLLIWISLVSSYYWLILILVFLFVQFIYQRVNSCIMTHPSLFSLVFLNFFTQIFFHHETIFFKSSLNFWLETMNSCLMDQFVSRDSNILCSLYVTDGNFIPIIVPPISGSR